MCRSRLKRTRAWRARWLALAPAGRVGQALGARRSERQRDIAPVRRTARLAHTRRRVGSAATHMRAQTGVSRSPTRMVPSRTMSARSPPRCTSGRRTPPPLRRSRWAHGSHRRRPRQRDLAEHELAADERVEVGSSHDDVAAVVDVAVERVEDGGVDERQRAAWPAGGEGPGSGGVAVAFQAPPGDGDAPRRRAPPAPRRPGRRRAPRRRRRPLRLPVRGGHAARSSGATT